MEKEPAYPTLSSGQVGESTWRYEGLTKLEYFAGLAMQGILSGAYSNIKDPKSVAEQSIIVAKELIKQLEDDI